MSNSFEEAALILREIKEDIDRRKERRSRGGPVNVFRGSTASSRSAASTTTSTDSAGSWTWGSSEYDHDELGD